MQALAVRRPTGEGADKLLRRVASSWLSTDMRSVGHRWTVIVAGALAVGGLVPALQMGIPMLTVGYTASILLAALGVMRISGARVRTELKTMLAEGSAVPARRVNRMATQVNANIPVGGGGFATGMAAGGRGMLVRQDLVRFEWHGETHEVPLPPRLRAHRGPLVAFLKDGVEKIWVLSDTEVQEFLDADSKALGSG